MPSDSNFNFKSAFDVFKVLVLKITLACLFCMAISLVHLASPNSLTPNSSIQSGMDSRYFRSLESSSKRPFIFLEGVPSKYFQSGNFTPLSVAHTANKRQASSLLNGSLICAISAYKRFQRTIS